MNETPLDLPWFEALKPEQIAEALGMTTQAVNSALQRARATMERAQLRSDEYIGMEAEPDPELLKRYVEAFEQFDIPAIVALFHEEGSMSMPPFTMWVRGREDLSRFFYAHTLAL